MSGDIINVIMDGIIAALRGAFPEAADIYTEDVKQGLQKPCFFVWCETHSVMPYPGGRQYVQSMFSITYLPKNELAANEECAGVLSMMPAALKLINAGGAKLRGTGRSGQIVDGAVVFTVSFNMYTREAAEYEYMAKMQPSINLKG